MKNLFYCIFVLALLTIIAVACNDDNKINEKLVHIDTLLNRDLVDSAESELNVIIGSLIAGEADRAYYNLLKTETDYRLYKPIKSDTLIDYSVSYYAAHNNNYKLAKAYYYKGVINTDIKNTKSAVANIKRAEILLENVNDNKLHHRIYETMAYHNLRSEDYDIALKYSKRNLDISLKSNNKNWIAYALINIGVDFYYLGESDSSQCYIQHSMSYLKYIPKKDRAYFYANIGAFYAEHDEKKAELYFIKSLNAAPITMAFNELANLYQHQDKAQKARKLFMKACKNASVKFKIDIMQSLANMDAASGNYQSAYILSQKANDLAAVQREKLASDNIRNIQYQYDYEKINLKAKNRVRLAILATVILALIIIASFMLIKYKDKRNKNKILQNQLLINIYNIQINELKDRNTDRNNAIENLKNKIADLQENLFKRLHEGRELYNNIIKGETTVSWSKSDFIHFIEYYKLIDLPFVIHLETDYRNLSSRYKFFEILYNMGKTDEEVEHILAIGSSTVRTNRTRIKAKLKIDRRD